MLQDALTPSQYVLKEGATEAAQEAAKNKRIQVLLLTLVWSPTVQ